MNGNIQILQQTNLLAPDEQSLSVYETDWFRKDGKELTEPILLKFVKGIHT